MGLEGFELLGLRGDEVVEAGEAVGDALLFGLGWKCRHPALNGAFCDVHDAKSIRGLGFHLFCFVFECDEKESSVDARVFNDLPDVVVIDGLFAAPDSGAKRGRPCI